MAKHFIYAIQHNETKKVYIGCSKNVPGRYQQHISRLRHNKHSSKEMQEDFDKYGEDFSVFILEEIENIREEEYKSEFGLITTKHIAEYKWMKEYDTLDNGYNSQDYKARYFLERGYSSFPFKKGLPEKPPLEGK